MGIPGKGLNTSLDLSTKSPNKKLKARVTMTENNNQDFRKFLKEFKNSPYLGYRSKQVYNEPTESYFFRIKYMTKIMKNKRHIRIRTKYVKSIVNKKNGHVK